MNLSHCACESKTTQLCCAFATAPLPPSAGPCSTVRQLEERRSSAAGAADCGAAALSRVLAAVILAAIEHFNHLVLALSGSKLCFLILVVLSSFLNCCISVSKYTHLAYSRNYAHIHIYMYVCPIARSVESESVSKSVRKPLVCACSIQFSN